MTHLRYLSLFTMLMIQSCSAVVVTTSTLEQPNPADADADRRNYRGNAIACLRTYCRFQAILVRLLK